MSQDGQWVFILPKERRREYQSYPDYLAHNGKWIIYDSKDKIEGLGNRMLKIVGKDDVLEAKFTRNPALKVPEGYELGVHALIVYCDDRKKEGVKERLKKELKVEKMFWKYDRETLEEVMKSKVHDGI